MKKLFLIACSFLIMPAAFAYVTASELSDVEYLKGKGYSTPTLKTMDLQKYNQKGPHGTYERVYQTTRYVKPSGSFFKQTKEHLLYFYDKAKLYLDPAQDDDLFGNREATFTNKPIQEIPVREKAPAKVEEVQQPAEDLNQGAVENL